MDQFLLGLMTIVGPIILFALLIWVVLRSKRRSGEASVETTERATKANYAAEERARRDGTEGDG